MNSVTLSVGFTTFAVARHWCIALAAWVLCCLLLLLVEGVRHLYATWKTLEHRGGIVTECHQQGHYQQNVVE